MGKKLYPLQKASGKKMYHPGRIYTPVFEAKKRGQTQHFTYFKLHNNHNRYVWL